MTFRLIGDRDWKLHSAMTLRNHDDIIDALVKRDCARIASISDEHMAIFKKRVYEALDKDAPDAAPFSPI